MCLAVALQNDANSCVQESVLLGGSYPKGLQNAEVCTFFLDHQHFLYFRWHIWFGV